MPGESDKTISTSRTRRTVRAVNYAKEQEFSDVDVFEDSADEAPAASNRQKRGRSRAKADPQAGEEPEEEFLKDEKPIYTERNYDPNLLPIRERFTFLPEYEPDGSPRIDVIVGRRPVDGKEQKLKENGDNGNGDQDDEAEHGDDKDESEQEEEEEEPTPVKRKRGRPKRKPEKKKKKEPKTVDADSTKDSEIVEYEYLIKYKGRSYLHLEWKTGADMESMNKSAKALYRRYLKKLQAGTDDDLEDPNFDPSFAMPQKIVDEAEQEITVELTDRELIKWEKEREKALAEEEDEMSEDIENGDPSGDKDKDTDKDKDKTDKSAEENKDKDMDGQNKTEGDEKSVEASKDADLDWEEEEVDFSKLTLDRLRKIVNADGPYYQTYKESDNPYRDGITTEPPKKPRASYLFFQCTMRSYFQKKNPDATQGELMTILGDTWKTMTEEEQSSFIELAKEESARYEKERFLLEKAQRPNEVWQPMRRCRMVLDRISKDGFATIFLEPVDTEEFNDYEEIIDQPMDLGTVRTKLNNRKFQAPEQFARDVRKIWNNCKIYNQHGSAIWHVADYMSKVFERLYHAWVLEFRERYLRWVNPKSRPWEPTCRQCDGKCNTPDDQMVLCDHCDALYGFKCLKPPLKKLPSGVWHCADCKPKLRSLKGIRMLSAVAEQAARKRAELGDTPKKRIRQTMYLIKWSGLGYEFCTWETKGDLNDDALIAEYRRLNNTHPDEPDMPEDMLNKVLDNNKHIHNEIAGGVACIPELRSQLYAQTRALHFSKFGMSIPDLLSAPCGSHTKSMVERHAHNENESLDGMNISKALPSPLHSKEAAECLFSLVHHVSCRDSFDPLKVNEDLPPLLTGEYDAVVPITCKGLMMNVGEIHGSVAFLGYRTFPDGSKGPAELSNLIRNVGDKIVAVDGVSTVKKSFKEVIMMLRESGKNKFAYMRFLENKYSVCDSNLVSVGNTGRYIIQDLQKKFSTDRQRLLIHRKQTLSEEKNDANAKKGDDESDASLSANHDPNEESEDGSEGEFEPESDDDEALSKPQMPTSAVSALPVNSLYTNDSTNAVGPAPASALPVKTESSLNNHASSTNTPSNNPGNNVEKKDPSKGNNLDVPVEEKKSNDQDETKILINGAENMKNDASKCIRLRQETTSSLGYRLLDIDLGNSSDEGGGEDCVYFLDGVDDTFTILEEAGESTSDKSSGSEVDKISNKTGEAETVPCKRNDFAQLGERGKIAAAVILSKRPPCEQDFDNFPLPSSKEIEASKKKEDADRNEVEESQEKSMKRSTVKIEQISTATNETIHVWASAEAAAGTLQLPLDEIKRIIRGDYDEDIGDEVGGFRWRYALAGARVTAGIDTSGRGKKAKEAWLEFRDKLYDPSEPHGYKNNNRLRDYQVDGVNWLASTYYKRHGCILADEMGLGKTVQIVCYIEHLYRVEKIHRPYLVVVPLSTVEHWRREFEGWTDMICCVYHDRQRVWRDVLREYEWYYGDRPHTPDFLKFDVLVTTYDTLIADFDVISQIPFRVAVVDEAHRLRNQKGKLLECMREISARGTMQYGYQSRVLMSGTPLQNDLNELWTLLNFIEPFKFPDLDDFQRNFGNMSNRSQVEALQQIISPFMLRRVKEDVAKDIPAKEETVIDVELTSIQKQYYRAIFEHNHAFLSMGATRSNAPKLMNIQMELRKVCNHPFLLEGVEHRETERQYKEFLEAGKFEGTSPEEQQHLLNEHGYIMTSGKMVLLDKLLPKLRQEGHKVLIFSQMVKMLDFISEYCEFRTYPYERLDGRVRGTERQKAIDRFEREENSFIFLLSTRAGGVGINLTAADICIIFDSDWNPQNDVQAQARCHRIGQTRDVRIYRLITSRTFEQEMFDRASKKLGLEQAVLGTFGQDNEDDKPTNKEMEQLLKKGAYALIEDENDESGKAFCADDIENILAKRTRTRVVEGTKTASWLNKQGMVVSKSKFTSDSKTANLDMDDPLFWQKVMPDFVTPGIMLQKLADLTGDIVGGSGKGRGRGRGRGRKKKTEVGVDGKADVADERNKRSEEAKGDGVEEVKENEEDNEEGENEAMFQLTRTNQRKVHKFMSDLKSMMEGIFDEAEDETLPSEEKSTCQKLLLTISIDEKLFNEQQRHLARVMLKKLEGDRRRRCRTSEQSSRFSPAKTAREEEEAENSIPEELRILSRKQRKKRKTKDKLIEHERKLRTRNAVDEDGVDESGEDGFLQHSDDEADWSDVGVDLYQTTKKKNLISRKEAKRRRQWAADDDAATAAGRPWPVFPRNGVSKVLATVLEEVMKYDNKKGGVFSEPVSQEDFPEYYDQIKKPMDYGTMKEKLDRGEYRSAQTMQKDFILVMQNCLQFNSPDSDIVKDARQQALMRPSILRDAALKHNLFLAEDGSVLEISDEGDGDKKEGKQKRRRKRQDTDNDETQGDATNEMPIPRKRKGRPKKRKDIEEGEIEDGEIEDGDVTADENATGSIADDNDKGAGSDRDDNGDAGVVEKREIGDDDGRDDSGNVDRPTPPTVTKKPRIRLRVGQNGTDKEAGEDPNNEKKNKKRGPKRKKEVNQGDNQVIRIGIRKKAVSENHEDNGSTAGKQKKVTEDEEDDGGSVKRRKVTLQNEDGERIGKRKKAALQDNGDGIKVGKRKKAVSQDEDNVARVGKRKKNVPEDKINDGVRVGKRRRNVSQDEDDVGKVAKRKKNTSQEDEDGQVSSDEIIPISKRKRRKIDLLPTPKKTDKSSQRIKRRRNKLPLSEDRDNGEVEGSPVQVKKVDDINESIVDQVEGEISPERNHEEGEIESDKNEDKVDDIYLDLSLWKMERESLDGTFAAARAYFTKRGPWIIPSQIDNKKFKVIAKSTLAKMDRHDNYKLFAEAVSDSEAHGYSEIVKKPMDFGTMREKVDKKEYGTGSAAAGLFYKDFLLVFDNCRLYNDEDGEVVEEAARLLSLLPDAYVGACTAAVKKKQK